MPSVGCIFRLMPSVQSAYRSKHSTETAVLKVITDVLCAADQGEVSLLCMLDLSAAFNTDDQDTLIGHLQQSFGVKGLALSWIEYFFRNRAQSVSIDGCSCLDCHLPVASRKEACSVLSFSSSTVPTSWQ